MDWLQLSISTTTEGIEPVCAVLMEAGVTGMEIDDEKDFHNFLESNRDKWDYVDEELLKAHESGAFVKFYVTDNAAGADLRFAVAAGLDALAKMDEKGEYGSLLMTSAGMKEEDWAENWKQYFKPLKVGEKILILPEWESLAEPTNRTIFTVNPGMSFGTGSHHTTQLCIMALERYMKAGMSVLDLGCGSGILSIIALLLGAKDATAVDIDPNAIEIAVQNAKRNRIDLNTYRTFAGNVVEDKALFNILSEKEYDIILANIVADVIIGLEPAVPKLLKAGGTFITSGIIEERAEDVISTYEKTGLILTGRQDQGGWVSLAYTK